MIIYPLPEYENYQPSAWKDVKTTKTPRYLVVEKLKKSEEAEPSDDKDAFVFTNDKVKAQGVGFNIKRLQSGQIQRIYVKELLIDRRGLYTLADAKEVSAE